MERNCVIRLWWSQIKVKEIVTVVQDWRVRGVHQGDDACQRGKKGARISRKSRTECTVKKFPEGTRGFVFI